MTDSNELELMQSNIELATQVLELAKESQCTIGTAESCTGGLIAASLTAVPGSSSVVKGGIVSYMVEVKQDLLGVMDKTLQTYGVVSEQCALEMARGACSALGSDFAVATTGIAGPGGAEANKPVGTVCIAIKSSDDEVATTTCKGSTRHEVQLLAVETALYILKSELEKFTS